mmetsp:Transcript_21996/g.74773  ORF Transcript_21996/g.74773 Transcript_21996/m.74773 type:complete len:329 (-) Transcript_21996:254-1240(-)
MACAASATACHVARSAATSVSGLPASIASSNAVAALSTCCCATSSCSLILSASVFARCNSWRVGAARTPFPSAKNVCPYLFDIASSFTHPSPSGGVDDGATTSPTRAKKYSEVSASISGTSSFSATCTGAGRGAHDSFAAAVEPASLGWVKAAKLKPPAAGTPKLGALAGAPKLTPAPAAAPKAGADPAATPPKLNPAPTAAAPPGAAPKLTPPVPAPGAPKLPPAAGAAKLNVVPPPVGVLPPPSAFLISSSMAFFAASPWALFCARKVAPQPPPPVSPAGFAAPPPVGTAVAFSALLRGTAAVASLSSAPSDPGARTSPPPYLTAS